MSDAVRRRVARRVPALLAAGVLLVASTAHGQSWRTMTSARQVLDERPVSVSLRYGAGELTVRPGEEPMLYRMVLRYDEETTTPLATFDADARELWLGARGRGNRGRVKSGSRADIELTRSVPMTLDVDFGAGEATLELGGLSLLRLEVSTGASEATIRFSEPNRLAAERVEIEAGAADLKVYELGNTRAADIAFRGGVGSTLLEFSGAWARNASATVEMGIGSVTLRIPRDLGVKLERNSFLTSFDAKGLERRGDAYYSANWDSAPRQLTLTVTAAMGSIEIDWID